MMNHLNGFRSLLARFRKRQNRILLSACFFFPSLFLYYGLQWRPAAFFFLLSWYSAGREVLGKAFWHLKHKRWMNEYFLMSLATVGALSLGEFPEAAAVMLFYEVGEHIQSLAVQRSRSAIAALTRLVAESAFVLREGAWVEIEPAAVVAGDELLLKVGARVPVDSLVLEGISAVDEAALSGESLPRAVEAGDRLPAGGINLSAALKLRAEAIYEHSTVARILELTEDASARKARSERLIRRFARVYTPAVVLLALSMAILPPLIFSPLGFVEWFRRALNLLVISCPCAFVLAVPLSYFSGLGLASSQGILVKGSDVLERMASIRQLVFDKTGTISEGRFCLEKLEALAEFSEGDILQTAARLEFASTHPLALAVVEAARADASAGEPIPLVESREIPGRGVWGRDLNGEYLLGNEKLMRECSLRIPERPADGHLLWLAVNRGGGYRLAGSIRCRDSLKPEAPAAMQALRKLGIGKLHLFTGDRPENAARMVAELVFDRVEAGLMPQDKLRCLDELIALRKEKDWVAFVGDGINDAPVLSLADVGFAMGGIGSDAAIEAADVVLLKDDLMKIPLGIRIARHTAKIAGENIVLSIGIKILVILLSFLGIGGLWAAVFADVGVTLLAVLNTLRIRGHALAGRAE